MPYDFEKQSYWHERYKTETSFEWLQSSEFFWTLIEPLLSKLPRKEGSPRILQLGSGTSDLHNYFRWNGYLDVTNVDYEPLAIERGREVEKSVFGDVLMKYVVADVTQLEKDLPEHQKFDVVVDKSTVDAVSCGGTTPLLNMASGVRERLAEGGFWVSLSYSSSRFNVEGLPPFDVEVIHQIPTAKLRELDPEVYNYCYLLRPK
ncbi:S-adenosyl-L-methionine-dependent methyltransferase [Hypoxylon sp. NC0597]|nr:S-adenosyl-L-methionine-dependent methyltransferase [Hypoxylon sp. NC0597]